MILAPYDQHVGLTWCGLRAVEQAHVVIHLVGVPKQPRRHRACRHTCGNYVGAIRRLLGVHRDAIDDRRVRRDHNLRRTQGATIIQVYRAATGIVGRIVHGLDMRAGHNASATATDGLGQPSHVAQDMKLRLPRKAQCTALENTRQRVRLDQFDIRKSCTARCLEFSRKPPIGVFRGRHPPSIKAHESTLDLLLQHNSLDRINTGPKAFGQEPCHLGAVHFLDLVILIVERGAEVRRGACRLPSAKWPVIQHQHPPPCAHELVSSREPRNAGADDTHVDVFHTRQHRERGHWSGQVPDGRTDTFIAAHGRRHGYAAG